MVTLNEKRGTRKGYRAENRDVRTDDNRWGGLISGNDYLDRRALGGHQNICAGCIFQGDMSTSVTAVDGSEVDTRHGDYIHGLRLCGGGNAEHGLTVNNIH